jgi:hypothetical protein
MPLTALVASRTNAVPTAMAGRISTSVTMTVLRDAAQVGPSRLSSLACIG